MVQDGSPVRYRHWFPIACSVLLVACQLPATAPQPVRQPAAAPVPAVPASRGVQPAAVTADVPAPADADQTFAAAAEVEATVAPQASTTPSIGFRAPAAGGVAFSNPLGLDYRLNVKGDLGKHVRIRLDGQDVTDRFHAGALDGQWTASIPDLTPGRHTLSVSRGTTTQTQTFDYRPGKPLDQILALADATVLRLPAQQLKWDWGPGLLLYALARLDAHTGSNRYEPYIKTYFAHHRQMGLPKVDWSDKCAPALAAIELYKRTNDPAYKDVADRVTAYLKQAKPTRGGGLNHFGTYLFSKFYPQSMWVDSLMMYNVFAARWGAQSGDTALQAFAAEQPVHFAQALQDDDTGLWKHARLTTWKKSIPGTDTYWLRGNGWAMASFPEILDALPASAPQRTEIVQRFRRQASALLPHQGNLGLWTTVLNRPAKAYLETSGTALCAYGLMHGAKQGYLSAEHANAGQRAFLGVMDRLQPTLSGPSMPEISHNTMPYPELGYTLIPQVHDMPYGLAALILAGIAYDEESNG